MYLTWTDCTQYIHYKNSNGCRLILICTSYIGSIQLSWDSWLNMLLPVTLALKILQGESSVHMGFLLPTLNQLQDELNKQESSVVQEALNLGSSIAAAISSGSFIVSPKRFWIPCCRASEWSTHFAG